LRTAEQREYLVGAAAAVFLAVGLILIALTNRAGFKTDRGLYHLSADFGRVDGVSVGTPVRVAGVDVGSVSHMTVDARSRAVLTFRFDREVALPDDTAAVIETDGLFGQKYVELRPGGSERNLRSGASVSFTQDSVILEDLVALIVQRAKAAQGALTSEAAPADNAPALAPVN
jgi:phospholipid/cholesterol/gamma-HCH transport system substrate-binding protein